MKGYAVVTGASSGIGAEFARQLAKKGYRLILTARRLDKLMELAEQLKTECIIVLADLSKETDCYEFFERIKDEERMLVIVNRTGEEHKFVLPEEYKSSDKVYTLKKSKPGVIAPYGGIAIKK